MPFFGNYDDSMIFCFENFENCSDLHCEKKLLSGMEYSTNILHYLFTIFISFSGEFLVSAPNRVEKISIGYAKQAKKMDMKRLKAVEWSILQTSCIIYLLFSSHF